ncbi:class F sortase [Streptomyces sp. A244]|uniref:class F sortase n=1 Tax=Streptomyces sp. A244 TaxID=2137016 RepID=UPI0026D455F0|nr:class F sortase [Streptomyces sp. A244]
MAAVSVLLVAGVCWDRGEEPGSTVTALPRDFTPAAHPAGSGTGTAALPHSSRPGAAASPGAPGARTGTAALPAPSTAPGSRTGPPRTPPPPSATPRTRGPATTRPAANGPRTQGPHATPHPPTPGPRKANPVAPPRNRPAAATPRPAPPKPAARAPARAVRKPHRPAGLRPLPRSRATRLLIPYLRLDAPVMGLGLDRDRRLTAPPDDDPELVGWYRHGASPGEQGTAVAVGHLDTDSGPAVFAGLTELKRGRIVKARRADGRTAVYTVDKIKSYEKADFPSQEVYGARGRPELRLITCGGSYDRRKGYSGNVVVFAHLTGIR